MDENGIKRGRLGYENFLQDLFKKFLILLKRMHF